MATALSCPKPLAPALFEMDGSSVLDRPPLPQKARGNNRWGCAGKGGMTARAVGKVTALARLPARQGEAHCLVSVPELFAKSATWRPVLSPRLQQSASDALWCRRQELLPHRLYTRARRPSLPYNCVDHRLILLAFPKIGWVVFLGVYRELQAIPSAGKGYTQAGSSLSLRNVIRRSSSFYCL